MLGSPLDLGLVVRARDADIESRLGQRPVKVEMIEAENGLCVPLSEAS
jgi:hypothetical protein